MKKHDNSGQGCYKWCHLLLISLICFAFPSSSSAAYPSWWINQGIVSGTAPNDYAAANQGQAKNFAVAAVNEFNADLVQFGGAGATLDALANALLTSTNPSRNDYAVINLGQLKTLAQPFYDQLYSMGITATSGPLASGTYPWVAPGSPAPNDYAIANIGQLKSGKQREVVMELIGLERELRVNEKDAWIDCSNACRRN